MNSKKNGVKKMPLAGHYCNFILFLKTKDKKKIKSIVKNLPKEVINALSEVILNGYCGNIPLNERDIQKLKPYRKLMEILSNKNVKIDERKKLMSTNKGGSLLSILIPLASSVITNLLSRKNLFLQ